VPSVKVFEYAGLEEFSAFLSDVLGFASIQPLKNYELGIALGALEMDLLTLSAYFTIFPNEGVLKPLTLFSENSKTQYLALPMQNTILEERRVADEEFVQLVNKILSDREAGVEQFGIKSNLNLSQKNYALKTGTSRNYHDSWTIGYTPDFLVGVWLGNSKNTPMKQVSGQTGAGKIWHEAMDIMIGSSYNKKTPFAFDRLESFSQSGSVEYGLPGDNYLLARDLLKSPALIKNPHRGDSYTNQMYTSLLLRKIRLSGLSMMRF
jgi:membrane carboxypeptidase/penicillin-binding protein PbpC